MNSPTLSLSRISESSFYRRVSSYHFAPECGLLFLALLALLLPKPFAPFFAVITVICVALVLPKEWTFFRRILTVFPVLLPLVSLIAVLFLWTGISLRSPMIFFPIAAVALYKKRSKDEALFENLFDSHDLIALVVFILAAFIFIPSIVSYGGGIPIPSQGEDNISHLSIYLLIVEHDTLLFGAKHLTDRNLLGLLHYPQAFHLNAAIFFQAILEPFRRNNISAAIGFFVIFCILWFSLFASQLSYALLDCLGVDSKKEGLLKKIPALASFFLIGIGWIPTILYHFGFYSQIAALLLLVSMISFLVLGTVEGLLGAFLLSIGISATWFFLSPVAIAVLALWTIKEREKLKKINWILLWGASLIIQTLFVVLSLRGIQTSDAITAQGGILIPPGQFIWAILLGAFLVPILVSRKENVSSIRIWSEASVIAALFTATIYVVQLTSVGRPSYYFYKSVYTILFPLMILSGVSIMLVLEKIWKLCRCEDNERRYLYWLFCSLVVPFGVFQYVGEHYDGRLANDVHFLDRATYQEMLRLHDLPVIKDLFIYPIASAPSQEYFLNRIIPVIVGSKSDISKQGLPLQLGAGYHDWLFKHLQKRKAQTIALVFDRQKLLRQRCARNFFELQKMRKIQIVPREAAQWNDKRCGAIDKPQSDSGNPPAKAL